MGTSGSGGRRWGNQSDRVTECRGDGPTEAWDKRRFLPVCRNKGGPSLAGDVIWCQSCYQLGVAVMLEPERWIF